MNIFEVEPYIDRSPKLNESELTVRLQSRMPNLPLVYWYQNKNKQLGRNTSCAQFPGVYDIHFNNIYWQQMDSSNGTFFLYGAYLDVREERGIDPMDIGQKGTLSQLWRRGRLDSCSYLRW